MVLDTSSLGAVAYAQVSETLIGAERDKDDLGSSFDSDSAKLGKLNVVNVTILRSSVVMVILDCKFCAQNKVLIRELSAFPDREGLLFSADAVYEPHSEDLR
jgi:hypothetical protein